MSQTPKPETSLLPEFREIIAQLVPKMCHPLANIDVYVTKKDCISFKTEWWKIRKQIDTFVDKIEYEVRPKAKVKPKLHTPHPNDYVKSVGGVGVQRKDVPPEELAEEDSEAQDVFV